MDTYKFNLFPLVLAPDQPDQSGQDNRAKTLRQWLREGLKEHPLTRLAYRSLKRVKRTLKALSQILFPHVFKLRCKQL